MSGLLRKIAYLAVIAFAALQAISLAAAGSVTDSAGRAVSVPERVEKVFAAGAPASVLVYVLAPDMLTGWPRALRIEEKPYVTPAVRELPELGMLTGRGGSANLETVLRVKPDVIIDFGSVRDTFVSLADSVQAQTAIPYLLIDGRLDATASSLRLLGAAIGRRERAEKLAQYVETRLSGIAAAVRDVEPGRRPKVYLARGPDGLESGVAGSINTEIIERAGGRNVIEADAGRKGLVRVSMEQILLADPDVVVTWDRGFYERAQSDPLWKDVRAVREGRLYLSPVLPFGWIDRPPSLNRLMGLIWLAKLFYPDRFKTDLRESVREFYALFYHVDLADAELDRLMPWTPEKTSRP